MGVFYFISNFYILSYARSQFGNGNGITVYIFMDYLSYIDK